jgi:hypothetical protein
MAEAKPKTSFQAEKVMLLLVMAPIKAGTINPVAPKMV